MADGQAALVNVPWSEVLPPDIRGTGLADQPLVENLRPMTAVNGAHRILGHNVTHDAIFNFSWNEAYDIIQRSQNAKILLPEAEITLIAIYAVLMSSGIISNILVCFVVMKQSVRNKTAIGSSGPKSRNLYVANLAVADLILCCICMPFTLISLIQYQWTFGSLLCKLVPVVQGTNIMVSAGTITAIAFDRYITIVRPPGSRVLYNHARCKVLVVITLIWILSFAITSPVFFYTAIEPVTFYNILLYEKCIERWPSNLLYTTFTVAFALMQFVIPGLVLITIHLRISAYLKLHMKPMAESQPKIEVHSPAEAKLSDGDSTREPRDDDDRKDDSSGRELLHVRKESIASDNWQRGCDSPRKLSDSSRKSSTCCAGGTRNSCDISPRKRSDLLSFRDTSEFSGFSFYNFSEKSKPGKCHKRARRELRRNRRTMFTLSCIAVAYAVSWLPMTMYQILITQIPRVNQNPKTVYVAFAVCHIFAMSTTITNPLLYGWLNPNFRREFYVIFSSVASFFSKLFATELNSSKGGRTIDNLTASTKGGFPGLQQKKVPVSSLAYVDDKLKSAPVTVVATAPRMQL